MTNDPITDAGFIICMIGLLTMTLSGMLLLPRNENLFDKIVISGAIITVLGGIIILVGIT